MKKRRIIEMFIDETDEQWGVDAISVVEFPAIEKNFMAFNKAKPYQLAHFNEERKIIIGPALIPNKEIVRFDESGEFYIKFSDETVRKAAHLYLKRNRQHNTTEQHLNKVQGCTLVESWITESGIDKAKHLGFDVPPGTWMVGMSIDNKDIWAKVKKGEVKGFSIEGFFTEMMANTKGFKESNEPRPTKEQVRNAVIESIIGLTN